MRRTWVRARISARTIVIKRMLQQVRYDLKLANEREEASLSAAAMRARL